MLNLWCSRTGTNCDGSTRRDFLKIGGLRLSGFFLSDLFKAREGA